MQLGLFTSCVVGRGAQWASYLLFYHNVRQVVGNSCIEQRCYVVKLFCDIQNLFNTDVIMWLGKLTEF